MAGKGLGGFSFTDSQKDIVNSLADVGRARDKREFCVRNLSVFPKIISDFLLFVPSRIWHSPLKAESSVSFLVSYWYVSTTISILKCLLPLVMDG